MARAARKVTVSPAIDAESRRHAELALEAFRAAKGRALKLVSEEKSTKRKAVESLRRFYDKLCDVFLRASRETTYAMWCELVKPEWDELAAAAQDDAIWDRLVDTYQERDRG